MTKLEELKAACDAADAAYAYVDAVYEAACDAADADHDAAWGAVDAAYDAYKKELEKQDV